MKELRQFSTFELVEELKKREGVKIEYAEPHKNRNVNVNGPAEILIVTD